MTFIHAGSSRTSLTRSMALAIGGGLLGPIMAVWATTKAWVTVVLRGTAAVTVRLVAIVRIVGGRWTLVTVVVTVVVRPTVMIVVGAVCYAIWVVVRTSAIAMLIWTKIVIVINIVTSASSWLLFSRVMVHKAKVHEPLLTWFRTKGFWYNHVAIPIPKLWLVGPW